MSNKNSLNTLALVAVFAVAIFVVAFALFIFVAGYRFMGSFFMAALISLVAAIVLFLGFGSPSSAAMPAQRSASPGTGAASTGAAATGATGAATASGEAAAAAVAEKAAAEEASRRAAADAEAAAAAKRAAEAEAAEKANAEATRRAADDEARKAAEAEAEAARAAVAPDPSAATTEDYDGDGVREGVNEGTRPAGLDAPRDGKADDLKQIKGIGPKMEKLCNALGFWHFDQVAAWSPDEVAWVDANLQGFKGRVTRDKWVAQAAILAGGGETEFSKRVEDGDVY